MNPQSREEHRELANKLGSLDSGLGCIAMLLAIILIVLIGMIVLLFCTYQAVLRLIP